MLDEQEQAKIIDFGSSSCYQDQEEGKSAIETPIPITNANPSYLAPGKFIPLFQKLSCCRGATGRKSKCQDGR